MKPTKSGDKIITWWRTCVVDIWSYFEINRRVSSESVECLLHIIIVYIIGYTFTYVQRYFNTIIYSKFKCIYTYVTQTIIIIMVSIRTESNQNNSQKSRVIFTHTQTNQLHWRLNKVSNCHRDFTVIRFVQLSLMTAPRKWKWGTHIVSIYF